MDSADDLPSPLNVIVSLVHEAEAHTEAMATDRLRAIEYEKGVMKDTPADDGRSQMVSRDVRVQVKKAKPPILRTLLGSDKLVEFQPVDEGDEEGAEQATDYFNFIAVPECDIKRVVEDAIDDAMVQRNGILKWWYEEKLVPQFSRHTGITEDQLGVLIDEDTEVVEKQERMEMVETPDGIQQIPVYDLKIKKVEKQRRYRASCVDRANFLIHPDACSIEDSPIVGEKTEISRSDLVAMGYDRELVLTLPDGDEDDYESDARRSDSTTGAAKMTDMVDYYDIFVRVDADDDGIAELRHVCFAGGLTEKHKLVDEEVDEVQYADLKIMNRPHQFEGLSIADDEMDIQRVNTVLLRQTLDNLYWQNNPQPTVQEGVIENMDAVLNPRFGLPIRVKAGIDVRAALGVQQIPFVANESFAMIEFMKKEGDDRTGVSDAAGGLPQDALQNVTAKASAMIEAQGIGQIEQMARTLADGLRKFYRGFLRMMIRHQDVPRTVRLRGEWVQVDPRQWNAGMDCVVNTGLGAGTRERDMMVMQQVMMLQEKMLAGFGPDNPFVKPENVYNALERLVEAAGLKTPDLYFTSPDPAEVEAKLKAMREAPSPEMIKAQADQQKEQMKAQLAMQMKQMELQYQAQMDQMKAQIDLKAKEVEMQAAANKELAQMQADLQVKAADRETKVLLADKDLAFKERELLAHQKLEYTKLGLAQNEDGNPIHPQIDQVMQVMQQMAAFFAQASKPKRVIRDQMGEIVGVEPFDPEPKVIN